MADDKQQTETVRKVRLKADPEYWWRDPYYKKYGFTFDGPRQKQFRSTDGRLYRPLWYICRVEKNGPAQKGGFVPGDCILEV